MSTLSPVVSLRSADGATADVHLDGAHVTSWRPASDGDERLFLSAKTELREGAAIRGGIPVIFPQFAAEGPLPRHGFARTTRWTLTRETSLPSGDASATFELRDSDATRRIWPVSFVATLTVVVGGDRLSVALDVRNTSETEIHFTAALHTYLRVRDIDAASLTGLSGVPYRESGSPGVLRPDDAASLHPRGEVDRVYVDVPGPVVLHEPGRTTTIESTGFPDVVVWNPGAAKAAALADMEPGGERRMLCVEAAAVQRPVVLSPGARWSGEQRLTGRK